MIAYKQGDYGRVVELMMPIRYDIRKLGGSHVQRDVFVQTLLQSAVKSGQHNLARALMSERVALKPNSSVSWRLQETLAKRRQVVRRKVAIVSWSGWTLAATKRTPISRCVARSIRRLEKIPLA